MSMPSKRSKVSARHHVGSVIADKVQAGIPDDIAQFIDVEAADSQGEETSDYDESEEGFIIGVDEDEHTGRVDGSEHFHQSDDLTRWDNAKVLETIALDIRHRHEHCPSASETQPSVLHPALSPLPDIADPGIWRVRVKDGYERDIVFRILYKGLLSAKATKFRVLAAFSRDTISGSVYIESFTPDDVRDVLTGIPGVNHSQQKTPCMDLIPLDERAALLDMSTPSTIRRGSWVRIKRRGSYRGDLGLVMELVEQCASAEVALVPRIVLNLKRDRKKRAKRALFDPQTVAAMYGTDAVVKRNQVFVFANDVYKSGLLRRDFEVYELSGCYVNATHDELDLFSQTHDDWVAEAANAKMVPLRTSDKVKIVAGSCYGLVGHVTNIEDEQSVTIESDSSPVPLQALIHEVRKRFDLGDFVEVMYGEHRGVAGFIVEMDDHSVAIYRQKRVMYGGILHQLPGDEVKVDSRHIDWKSPDLEGPLLPYDARRDDINSKMFTGDPYKGMEISIHAGDAKMHFGVVRGSRIKEGKVVVDAVTLSRTVNHAMTLDLESVRERDTGLPLAKALWVPKNGLPLWDGSLTVERPMTPSTPIDRPGGPQSPAWDPKSEMPGSPSKLSSIDYDPLRSGELPVDPQSAPGEWLRDSRLLHKRLDVRIQGTLATLWHNGRYEGQCGYMVLTKVPSHVKDSVVVKVGFTESRISFLPCHISPLHTTQRPGFVSSTEARPIISVVGERVVIIGADLGGKSELIGNYAVVVHCRWPLAPDQVCVQVASHGPFWGQFSYFNEKSLCRSHSEPVNWMETMVE